MQFLLGRIMSVNTVALMFDIWAAFLVAVVLVLFLVTQYKRRSQLSLEERQLILERQGIANDDAKTFWTLQQYDEISGNAWHALLEHDAAGVLRGWTGYRAELDSLARILNVTPRELPPTTPLGFFSRTNISVLRPFVGKT